MGGTSACDGHATRWLWITGADPDELVVTVVGGAAAERADELWSALEGAMEVADGRLVVTDLTEVTAFDLDTVHALVTVSRAAARRRDALCFVMQESSPLGRCARSGGLYVTRTVYPTVTSAVVGYRNLSVRPTARRSDRHQADIRDTVIAPSQTSAVEI